MKKSLFLLMFSIISLSIYSQMVQISQFWDIHHKFLRSQYNVLKSTNEKHGVYREWSLNDNLIISCNYSKNELNKLALKNGFKKNGNCFNANHKL